MKPLTHRAVFFLILSLIGLKAYSQDRSERGQVILDFNNPVQTIENFRNIKITNLGIKNNGNVNEIVDFKVIEIPITKAENFIAFSLTGEVQEYEKGSIVFLVKSASADRENWSDWQELTLDEHAYSADHINEIGKTFYSRGVSFDKHSKFIKLRVEIADSNVVLKKLILNFFSPVLQSENSKEFTTKLTGTESCPCPTISYVTRTGWGCPDGQNSPGWTPVITSPVTHLLVHHAAGYGTPPYPAQVLAIWNQHAISQGWGDIGYNWLIAPDGTLYQGRAWSGASENIVAGHMCACNSNKIGICLLGDFTSSLPTSAAYSTLVKLLALKACSFNITSITGSGATGTKVFLSCGNCSLSCYTNGTCTSATINNISGHRDGCRTTAGNCTSCPGDAFYPQLATLRTDVLNYINNCGSGCSQPSNDGCSGSFAATPLTFGTSCNTISSTSCGATSSGFSSCVGTQDDDVFFRFTPTGATATITVTSSSGYDAAFQVLTGPCGGSMSQVTNGCVNNTGTGGTETVNLTGLNGGTQYFIRVWHFGTGYGTTGNFTICAYSNALPDLSITSGTQTVSSTTVTAGNNITASCSEDNSGTGPAGANHVTLWLSSDNVLNTGSDTYLGQIAFPSLPALSNSLIQSSSITIPAATCSGSYYLFFWADGNQVVVESNESNNFASRIITVNAISLSSPSAATATGISSTGFQANWGSVSGATSYRLDVSTNSSFSSYVSGYQDLNVGNTTSRALTGLTCNTTYYYRVRAVNSCVNSGNSSTINVSTSLCCSTPGAPSSSAATNITQTTFQANWSSVSGATSYRLDVSTNSSFSNYVTGYQGLNVGSVTLYSVNGLTCNTTYYYRIRAVNTCNVGANSGIINVSTTGCCSTPSIPSSSSATSITQTTFQANWGAVSGAVSYRLDVSASSSFANYLPGYQDFNVGNVNSIIVTGLTCNTTYYYRVRAMNTCQISGNSAIINLTTSVCGGGCVSPSVTSSPISQSVTAPNGTTFSISAAGSANVYQWQLNDGTGWSNLSNSLPYSGVTTTNLSIASTNLGFNGYQYRCVVSSTCTSNTAISNSATLSVGPGCVAPFVTTHPVNQTVAAPNLASFSVVADGTSNIYQWQFNAGAGWLNLTNGSPYAGVTTSGLLINPTNTGMNSYQYRCIISSSCSGGSVTSNVAVLTINSTCITPSLQASISSTSPEPNQILLNLVSGNGNRRIVKCNTVNSFTDPVNGTDQVGNSVYAGSGEQVVFNGNATNVMVTGLQPNTNYCFRAYEANCSGPSSVYNVLNLTTLCQSTTIVTALPPVDGLEDFRVFPNPGEGTFFVKVKLNTIKDVSFKVFNISGQQIYQSPISRFNGTQIITIDGNRWPNGLYFLETTIGESVFARKLIVQRM